MRILFNKKLATATKQINNLLGQAELAALPTTIEEAREFLASAPTPEARQARKQLLHGTMYGGGPQVLLASINRTQKEEAK